MASENERTYHKDDKKMRHMFQRYGKSHFKVFMEGPAPFLKAIVKKDNEEDTKIPMSRGMSTFLNDSSIRRRPTIPISDELKETLKSVCGVDLSPLRDKDVCQDQNLCARSGDEEEK